MFIPRISIKKYIGILIIGEFMLISMSILEGTKTRDIFYFIIAYFLIVFIFSLVSTVLDNITGAK